jgi:outer membrane immunogenic protein
MKTVYLLAAGATALVATPAFAQEFTGPRVEARVSYDQVDFTIRDLDDEDEDTRDTGFEIDGPAYGVELGFDAGAGNARFGGYVGADMSRARECVFEEDDEEEEACIRGRRNFNAGVRGGFVAGGSALLYLKGGYSQANFRASFEDEDGDIQRNSESFSGFHLGGGVEGRLTPNLYLKAEYVFTKYGAETDEDLRTRANRDQFTVGLGFRF